MTLVSINTFQDVNVWGSLLLYLRLGLAGWQLTHGHHFLSWGRSVFVPEAPDQQGCVLAAGTEIHGPVCQLQGGQTQLKASIITELFS